MSEKWIVLGTEVLDGEDDFFSVPYLIGEYTSFHDAVKAFRHKLSEFAKTEGNPLFINGAYLPLVLFDDWRSALNEYTSDDVEYHDLGKLEFFAEMIRDENFTPNSYDEIDSDDVGYMVNVDLFDNELTVHKGYDADCNGVSFGLATNMLNMSDKNLDYYFTAYAWANGESMTSYDCYAYGINLWLKKQ